MSEAGEIKRDGAIAQKNSGRGIKKGDAIIGNFLVDYKEVNKSFTLNKNVWGKVTNDAFHSGSDKLLDPALKVIIGSNESGKIRLYIVEEHIIEEYLRLKENG